ncbi:MAG: hypothetical protein MUE40_21090, partial [Anaerolineae bacterium]|nr:hypothetical protein [Anaerolineae bacterium]
MKQLPPGRRGLCLALALLLLCLGAAPLAAQDVPALTVDAAAVQGAISPYVLGANYGGYGILPPDQMETAAAAGIRFMRFPGGSIFDEDGR